MTGISAVGGMAVGNLSVLVSTGRQHSIDDLAMSTATQIVNIDNVAPERMNDAVKLRFGVAQALKQHFIACISNETANLVANPEHCRKDYDVLSFINMALLSVSEVPCHCWESVIKSQEWCEAAKIVIGNMMATALHIERLWFAEDHPENHAAKQYRLRFSEEIR